MKRQKMIYIDERLINEADKKRIDDKLPNFSKLIENLLNKYINNSI